MKTKLATNFLTGLLEKAGICVNGCQPWDIRIQHEGFYDRVLREGSLGAGEAYLDRWWECDRLDEFYARLLKHDLNKLVWSDWRILLQLITSRIMNRQSIRKASGNAQMHYDLNTDLFKSMLDKRMTYTSAYWNGATNLDEAQEHKLDLTCRKLYLQPGMHVLDIGCGWGSFAKYAAENYGVSVTGITVSHDQVKIGNEVCAGLPVKIIFKDYRDITGQYDRVVSLGMFEHVGYKNYRRFMKIVNQSLKEDGLFLLHTIGGNKSVTTIDPWLDKYIFNGAMLPSIRQIGSAIEGLFVMEDWHNFSADYDRTLMAWYERFHHHWPDLQKMFDDRFFRLWRYYLLMCAGSFRSRYNQLWQIVLAKNGVSGGYFSIR